MPRFKRTLSASVASDAPFCSPILCAVHVHECIRRHLNWGVMSCNFWSMAAGAMDFLLTCGWALSGSFGAGSLDGWVWVAASAVQAVWCVQVIIISNPFILLYSKLLA